MNEIVHTPVKVALKGCGSPVRKHGFTSPFHQETTAAEHLGVPVLRAPAKIKVEKLVNNGSGLAEGKWGAGCGTRGVLTDLGGV